MDRPRRSSPISAAFPVISSLRDEPLRPNTPDSRSSRASMREKKQTTPEDQSHTEEAHLHYLPPRRPWHTRPRSPALRWHKDYTPTTIKWGRILVIDYVKQDLTNKGKRKVTSQEIDDVEGLEKIYSNAIRGNEAILRVFHVQNGSSECIEWLLKKFNINARDDLVGLDFDTYLRGKRLHKAGRKPRVSGRTWRTQHDPFRGLSKTAFGIDYFKPYRAPDPMDGVEASLQGKIMELNCLDHDENPCFGWNVHVQRLSCYVQYKERTSEGSDLVAPDSPRAPSPTQGQGRSPFAFSHLDQFDNGNAILIFEESQSGSIEDTIIPFRRHIESRWRRLPFYLAFDKRSEELDDAQTARECARMIMRDIWMAISDEWTNFLELSSQHVSILEDRIYENPANESLAPLLWTNSDMWLSVERLINIHTNVVRECQENLMETIYGQEQWLEAIPGEMQRLSNLVQEDLVKPTTGLADLMYKSVGIRDARHSLELSMSLWRLSWITFVFLPLTFLCGFFSMQVSLFRDGPSVKWYFIVAVPMMVGVLASWFLFKQMLEGSTPNPYTRGVYENFFQDLATSYPLFWTRAGPRPTVRPGRLMEKLKWWLITRWAAPENTGEVKSGNSMENLFDGLGSWSRIKRHLMRQWTAQMQVDTVSRASTSTEMGEIVTIVNMKKADTIKSQEEEVIGAETLQVPPDPSKRPVAALMNPRRSGSSAGGRTSRGSSGGRNSGVMVEEERVDWLKSLNA